MASQESEILSRVVGPENPSFTPEVAQSILKLRFGDGDLERMQELLGQARQGALNEEEESQLHGYLFVGAMLDLMHSKARLTLKNSAGGPDG